MADKALATAVVVTVLLFILVIYATKWSWYAYAIFSVAVFGVIYATAKYSTRSSEYAPGSIANS